MVNCEKIYFQSDIRLCGLIHRQKKSNGRAVVMCHGITVDKDEIGVFIDLAEQMAKQGFTVLRFDFRGHGESEMKQEDVTISGEVRDIEAAVAYMKSRGFQKVSLVGASVGGGSATIYAAQQPQQVEQLFLINPALNYDHCFFHPTSPLQDWVKNLFLGENATLLKEKGYVLLGRYKFHLGKKLTEEMKTLYPYEELKKLECPVIMFHGTLDSKVDYRDSEEYIQYPKGEATLCLYKGFSHGFHKPDEQSRLVKDLLHFL